MLDTKTLSETCADMMKTWVRTIRMDKYGMFHLQGFHEILQEVSNVGTKLNYSQSIMILGRFWRNVILSSTPICLVNSSLTSWQMSVMGFVGSFSIFAIIFAILLFFRISVQSGAQTCSSAVGNHFRWYSSLSSSSSIFCFPCM